jgi:hydrogenase maturation protease
MNFQLRIERKDSFMITKNKVKVIAIGNRLMGDDGIGIQIVEKIRDSFYEDNVDFIIGETDANYCLDEINKDDFVIIIDAMCSGNLPGTITRMKIEEVTDRRVSCSQHEISLIQLIKMYNKSLDGFIVGIEISSIDLRENLSRELSNCFDKICSNVSKIIRSQIYNVSQ